MQTLTIYVFDKNYSSWSMRAWLAAELSGLPYSEVNVSSLAPSERDSMKARSPSGLFPILEHGELKIWDSLAIGEYLAELAPGAGLWPTGREERAVARSISAEMHSGFGVIRSQMPMNLRAYYPGFARTLEAQRDIDRILGIWRTCRERHGKGGQFLFGPMTLADAMYAPVVMRMRTYDVKLDPVCEGYAAAICSHPSVAKWIAEAQIEQKVTPQYEYRVG